MREESNWKINIFNLIEVELFIVEIGLTINLMVLVKIIILMEDIMKECLLMVYLKDLEDLLIQMEIIIKVIFFMEEEMDKESISLIK